MMVVGASSTLSEVGLGLFPLLLSFRLFFPSSKSLFLFLTLLPSFLHIFLQKRNKELRRNQLGRSAEAMQGESKKRRKGRKSDRYPSRSEHRITKRLYT
jgi:hypothetical protein